MKTPTRTETNESRNTRAFREPWLMDGVNLLRPIFERANLTIPEKLRCSFGLNTSGKKSARKGECWPASASEDSHFEIFISPDIAEPEKVLSVLVYCLIHASLPDNAGHGPKYKKAATDIGLVGKMRQPEPNPLLADALSKIAEGLGPLPHARLNILAEVLDRPPAKGRPKKQGTRMLKAACEAPGDDENGHCGYTVRLSGKWVHDIGPPHCPKHGAMVIDLLPGEAAVDEPEAIIEPEALPASEPAPLAEAV